MTSIPLVQTNSATRQNSSFSSLQTKVGLTVPVYANSTYFPPPSVGGIVYSVATGLIYVSDGLEWYQSSASNSASFVTSTTSVNLPNERVLTAGTNITVTPNSGAHTITLAVIAGGAPSTSSYILGAVDSLLVNSSVITAGTGIVLNTGVGGVITVSAPVPSISAAFIVESSTPSLTSSSVLTAGTGVTLTNVGGNVLQLATSTTNAPTNDTYILLASNVGLPASYTLTSGTGISFVDGGAGSSLTINGNLATSLAAYFVAVNDPSLGNSSSINLAGGTNILVTDGGAGGQLKVNLNQPMTTTGATLYYGSGALQSLQAGSGIVPTILGNMYKAGYGFSPIWEYRDIPDSQFFFYDDFMIGGGDTYWQVVSGSGSESQYNTQTPNVYGAIQLTTGTSATGYVVMFRQIQGIQAAPKSLTNTLYLIQQWGIYLSALPSSSQTYLVRIGYTSQSSASTPGTAVAFLINYGTSTTNWLIESIIPSGGTNITTTSTAIVAGAWMTLRLVIDNTNTANFYINGTSIGTLSLSPSFASLLGTPTMFLQKSVGTTAATLLIDYHWTLSRTVSTRY